MTTKEKYTPKQTEFIYQVATNGGNATQAYRDAGYKVKTDTVARVESTRLLANPSIAAAVDRLRQRQHARSEVSAADILAGLHELATTSDRQAVRLGAWSKLADIFGLVRAKGGSGTHNTQINVLSGMTPDQLLEVFTDGGKARMLTGPDDENRSATEG